ncbi:uncharacterized protein LOC144453188 [Glandiceps talaboti]
MSIEPLVTLRDYMDEMSTKERSTLHSKDDNVTTLFVNDENRTDDEELKNMQIIGDRLSNGSKVHRLNDQQSIPEVGSRNLTISMNGASPVQMKTVRQRYLLPLMPYADGPSGQYIHIRNAVVAAIYKKRVIVISNLHIHHTQTTGPKGRNANETFDVDRLRKIVEIASLEDFKRDCETVFTPENLAYGPSQSSVEIKNEQYKKIRNQAKTFLNVSVPELEEVQPFRNNSMQIFEDQDSSVQCLGYVTPRFQLLGNATIEEMVRENFLRAPFIRKMADDLLCNMCNGSLALMHWRNKSGEYCRNDEEMSANTKDCPDRNKEGLSLLAEKVDTIINIVEKTVKNHNVSCLYVATAPYEQKMVHRMKERLKNLYTIDTAINLSKDLYGYRDDNWVLSLVEQQMAEQVPLFISCSGSQWSRFVELRRKPANRTTMALRDLPGIPPVLLNYKYLLK